MSDEDTLPWTAFDIRDLDKNFRDLNGRYKGSKLVKAISFKLRRSEKDVKERMVELGMVFQDDSLNAVSNRGDHAQETKDIIIFKKPEYKNQSSDDLPDIGVLLTKIKHDTALQHQDAIMMEAKITGKLEKVAAAINDLACVQREILALQKEYITVVREQHEVWKTKNGLREVIPPTKNNSHIGDKIADPQYFPNSKQKNIVSYYPQR